MKKLISITISLLLSISLVACGDDKSGDETTTTTTTTESTQPVIEQNSFEFEGFFVDGSVLYDANGNEFVMRGVNHSHTWFKNQTDVALSAIADTGANTVRIVLSDGGNYQKDDVESVKKLIQRCIEHEMIAVLEVHDATGSNSVADLQLAVDYWIDIKDALIGNEEYVILNIANEWVGKWDSEIWRDGYVSAIPQLRDAGIRNTIMVDAGGWGQYAKSIHTYANEVFESDELKNTMFSIHMYGQSGKNENTIKSSIEGVTNQDYCVIVGEFGYKHSDGDVDENYIMSYCEENDIGYLGWSWWGNGGDVTYLDIALTWDGTVLSPEWGENIINGENGIRNTSEECTVFN